VSRRALVTGAAAGLAAGIAPVLARDGFAHLAITYRSTPPRATLAAIEAAGASGAAARIDFLDEPQSILDELGKLARRHGPFDTLVHAVGPLVVKRFSKTTLDDYREAIDGNLRSAVLAAHAVLPAMREAGFGRIVFFGMLGSQETRPFRAFSLYQSAKSGLVAFARCLAIEEAAHGVTVNVVSPGDIRQKSIDRAQALGREARNPRGRAGSFEDVADAVRFFVIEERDFITGAVLEVTGGLQTAQD
jgi:3-oxoacyl-[acyl-carrier protein] reductase